MTFLFLSLIGVVYSIPQVISPLKNITINQLLVDPQEFSMLVAISSFRSSDDSVLSISVDAKPLWTKTIFMEPEFVSDRDVSRNPTYFDMRGDIVYLGSDLGIFILDISNKSNIEVHGPVNYKNSIFLVLDVLVEGTKLYVVGEGFCVGNEYPRKNHSLWIFDIAEIIQLIPISCTPLVFKDCSLSFVNGLEPYPLKLALSGNSMLVFVTTYFYGIEIFDVTNPRSLVSLKRIEFQTLCPTDISIIDEYAVVSTFKCEKSCSSDDVIENRGSGFLLIYDIHDPINPVLVGDSGDYYNGGIFTTIIDDLDTAYSASNSINSGVYDYNISNKAKPIYVDTIQECSILDTTTSIYKFREHMILSVSQAQNHGSRITSRIRMGDLSAGVSWEFVPKYCESSISCYVRSFSVSGNDLFVVNNLYWPSPVVNDINGTFSIYNFGSVKLRKNEHPFPRKCSEEGITVKVEDDSGSINVSFFLRLNGDCGVHGYCINLDMVENGYKCNCEENYVGEKCNVTYCNGILSNSSVVCSGNGVCVVDIRKCECCENYFGNNCEVTLCHGRYSNDTNVCSGNGNCRIKDDCACVMGYFGDLCEVPVCFGHLANESNQNFVCSGHGKCDGYDKCSCSKKYKGDICDTYIPSTFEIAYAIVPSAMVLLLVVCCCFALVVLVVLVLFCSVLVFLCIGGSCGCSGLCGSFLLFSRSGKRDLNFYRKKLNQKAFTRDEFLRINAFERAMCNCKLEDFKIELKNGKPAIIGGHEFGESGVNGVIYRVKSRISQFSNVELVMKVILNYNESKKTKSIKTAHVDPEFKYDIPFDRNLCRIHLWFIQDLKNEDLERLRWNEKFDESLEDGVLKTKTSFFIMPLYSAFSKREKIFGGEFPDREFFRFLKDICFGLQVLQTKNILHRDIKAGNLFYNDENGKYLIGDYGCVMVIDGLKVKRNQGDISGGTPYYCPPEVLKITGKSVMVDKWDVFSLGMTCYKIYSKDENPFGEEDNREDENYRELEESECSNRNIRSIIKNMLKPTYKLRYGVLDVLDAIWKIENPKERGGNSGKGLLVNEAIEEEEEAEDDFFL